MVTIVGIEYRKYKSKSTGKDVEGYNLHCTDDNVSDTTEGVAVYSEWVSPQTFAELGVKVGDRGYLSHNRFGRVDAFVPASA